MKLDEQFLINGLKQKDKDVFDLVFTFYYSGLCAYANRYVNNPEAAEDLVQDVFVSLWLSDCFLQVNTSLKSFFFTCVKNRALDYLRHESVKGKYAKRFKKDTEVILPDEMWEFTEPELREIIHTAIQKLPPRTREIFILNRFDGVSNDQIAESLNISKRTVEVQISNALKVLRKELKDCLPVILFFC
jgi:RNA polymerase sigma-70 factor (ECF subfamily)